MLNIGKRMTELVEHLHGRPLEGVDFWGCSLDGEQTVDYGLGRDFDPEPESHNYFDHEECRRDFLELVREWFKTDEPDVVVKIDGYNYIEVYREGFPNTPIED